MMSTTKRWFVASGAGLAVLLATFWAGRAMGPGKVVTRDVVKTQVQVVEKVVERVVHDVATVHDVQTRTVTVTKWAKAPDGTPVVTQETHQERASEAKTAARTQATRDATASSQQTSLTIHETIPMRPSWSLSIQPGVQFFGEKAVELKGPLVLGASVEHRFIGPLSIGLWGSTAGAAGITLRGDL